MKSRKEEGEEKESIQVARVVVQEARQMHSRAFLYEPPSPSPSPSPDTYSYRYIFQPKSRHNQMMAGGGGGGRKSKRSRRT